MTPFIFSPDGIIGPLPDNIAKEALALLVAMNGQDVLHNQNDEPEGISEHDHWLAIKSEVMSLLADASLSDATRTLDRIADMISSYREETGQ